DALGRNYKRVALGQALDRLFREGLAKYTVTKTAGRPVEWWFASTPSTSASVRINELNELSPPAPTPASTLNSFNSLSSSAIHATTGTCSHTNIREQNGQQVCLDCGELVMPPPSNGSPPPFTAFTASGL